MIPDIDEEKHALSDLYSGLGVCKAVDSRVVHITPEAAEIAIKCVEYYIQQMEG